MQITDIDKAAKQIEEGAVRKAIKRAIQTYSDDVLLQLKGLWSTGACKLIGCRFCKLFGKSIFVCGLET